MRTLCALVVLVLSGVASAAEPFALKDGSKVVFLGDSNTYAGTFITYLDAYLCTRFPTKQFELINLGLPSETVTGLSEPDHPFPRPNVHDRVDRALELTKPDVVVICYGMNDGIYSPFSEERFKKYQEGITKLVEKVEKAGAKVVLMTPPPFDPKPLKDKVQAKDAAKFSWLKPYERYDEEVLKRYSEWLLTLRAKKLAVVDLHAALARLAAVVRTDDRNYTVAPDGIHYNADGHMVAALELLKTWNAPSAVKEILIDTRDDPPTKSDVTVHVAKPSAVRFSFTLPRPMPADPAWSPLAKKAANFDYTANRYLLTIIEPGRNIALNVRRGTLDPKAKLEKGESWHAPANADDLATGMNLADVLQVKPDPKEADLLKLFVEKNRLLGPAWLSHVGHKRPDTPKGLPLDEAKKKAAALDEEIRKLCKPTEYTVSVGPLGKPGK